MTNQESAAALPPKARLGAVLREAVRFAWDKLGLTVGMSLTAALALMLAFAVGKWFPAGAARIVLTGGAAFLVLSAWLAGANYFANRIANRAEVEFADFGDGVRCFFVPIAKLAAVHAIVIVLCALNVWFYGRLGSAFGIAVTLGTLSALLLWGMMAVLHFPLLVAQESGAFDTPTHRAKRGTFAVLRRAFYLALAKPAFTLGLLAVLVFVGVLSLYSVIGVMLIYPGLAAITTATAARHLLIEFGVIKPPETGEPAPDDKFRLKI